MVVQCKKVNYFVTGEVFLLDIGLLMGAIVLKTAFTHLTDGNVRFFDQNFFKISNSLSLDLHTMNLLDPISQHPRRK